MSECSLMMLSTVLILMCGLCIRSTIGYAHHVSFYGDGYVQVPIRRDMAAVPEDADLELHFRTSRTDAILLLLAGPTDDSDYCLVTLERGSLVVRSYLGSGETTLRAAITSTTRRRDGDVTTTTGSATFGDLEWHFVNVTWSRGRVLLAVDRVYVDSASIRGRHSELNVVNGFALVGIGTGTPYDATAFLYAGRDYLPYRGCMHHVTFKGYDVFEIARSPLTPTVDSSSSGVTWNQCSAEFTASHATPISFAGNSSYALFEAMFSVTITSKKSSVKTGVSTGVKSGVNTGVNTGRRDLENVTTTLITFDIRTRSSNAIVFYGGAGPVSQSQHSSIQTVAVVDNENGNSDDDAVVPEPESSSSSFVIMEILNGRIVLRLVSDRSVLLASLVVVNDGSWHHVMLTSRRLSSAVSEEATVTLSVDGQAVEQQADGITHSRPLWNRFSQIFIGGVDARSRLSLLRRRLEYLVGPAELTLVDSLVGCIRNIVIHGGERGEVQTLGFPEMIASRGLQVGCIWTFPCGQPDQCPPNTECVEIGFDQLRCKCRTANCSTVADMDGILPAMTVRGPVRVRALVVDEGGRRSITSDHIDLIVSKSTGLAREQPKMATVGGSDESAVLFVVRNPAECGVIYVRNFVATSFADVVMFSLAELRGGLVTYVHDGSERPEDKIELQLQYTGNNTSANFEPIDFTLPIQVVAVNDRPMLILPVNDTLRVVMNEQLPVSNHVINTTDSDGDASQLVISVDYSMNDGNDDDKVTTYGYFIMTSSSATDSGSNQRGHVRVDRFTQHDINSGRLKFIHRGSSDKDQYFRLTVSDGETTSRTRVLRVVGAALQILPAKLTGVVVPRFATQIITSDNLTFVVSSADGALRRPDIDIRYEITMQPVDGEIQRQQLPHHLELTERIDNQMTSLRSWKPTMSFTQRQIDHGLIRYLHMGENPQLRAQSPTSVELPRADRIRFRATVAHEFVRGLAAPSEVEFLVEVVDCRAEVVRSTGLRVRGRNREVRVTSDDLRALGASGSSSDGVLYHVISTPRHGHLFIELPMTSNGESHRRKLVLSAGANFTQRDVDLGRLSFRFRRVLADPIVDDFEFRLIGSLIAGRRCSWQSDVALFEFRFEPPARSSDTDGDLRLINNGLWEVLEGDRAVITPDDLFVMNYGGEYGNGTIENFRYKIGSGPNHGRLRLYNPATGRVTRFNVTSFRNEDVRNRRLFYVHDDSEMEADSFRFTVTPAAPGRSDDTSMDGSGHHHEQLLAGTFEIGVILRNDNPPTRIVNRIVQLVVGRGRLLTLDDLQYFDPDMHYDSSNLEYSWPCRSSRPCVVLASNRSIVVERFEQRSLADGSLYVLDRSRGSINSANPITQVISVSDGLFNTSDIVQFTFVDPFVHVLANRSTINIRWNSSSALTVDSVAVDTNLDADDAAGDIRYVIIDPPQHGRVEITGSDVTPPQFTMSTIRQGLVSYRHDAGISTHDEFRFVVRLDNLIAIGEVSIVISRPSSTIGLTTTDTDGEVDSTTVRPSVKVESIMVEELLSVNLTSKLLEVSHPEVAPSDVIYSVTSEFRYGLLIVGNRPATRSDKGGVVEFTQSDVNGDLVRYQNHVIATGRPADAVFTDIIKFNVNVGHVTTLSNIEVTVTVFPSVVPLEVWNMTVTEGQGAVFDIETLRVGISSPDVVFVVIHSPEHGRIQHVKKPVGTGNPLPSTTGTTPSVRQFSLERMRTGLIWYVHDGSDNPRDVFTVFAQRSGRAETRSAVRTVNIIVLPVNDQPPRVTRNAKMNVWMGSETPIGREFLLTEDDDTEPGQLVYTLLSRPGNGDVIIVQPTRQPVETFTQMDIDTMNVLFVHHGASRGSFQFEVSDGSSTSLPQSFHIEAARLQLNIESLQRLESFPGVVQPITAQHLRAVTNDANQTRPITFHVRSKPVLGRIVIKTSTVDQNDVAPSFIEVTSFNQTDVDGGRIGYHHVTPPAETAWSQEDSFLFDVRTRYAEPLTSRVFIVGLSYDNINADNVDSLINSSRSLSVDEGGNVTLNRSALYVTSLIDRLLAASSTSAIHCFIVDIPRRGVLTVSGTRSTSGTEITQDDVDAGEVVYQHDDSDTTDDTFSISLTVERIDGPVVEEPMDGGNRKRNVAVFSFNVTVRPINDQPFQFVVKSPDMEVVQGSRATITRDRLLTIDSDTSPDQLVYHVTVPPTNGQLMHVDLGEGAVVGRFTQRDIDDEKIAFVQDGSRESGAFYFQVSDGVHRPLSKIFGIRVIPVFLRRSNGSDLIELLQGELIVTLTVGQFGVDTNNFDRSAIIYNVTKSPDHAHICLDYKPVVNFTQKDVDDGRITYIMVTYEHAFDDFQVTINDQFDNRLHGLDYEIEVRLRMKISQFPVQANGLLSITLAELDASELYELTGVMPIYFVIKPPLLGVLKVIEPSDEGANSNGEEGDGAVADGDVVEQARRRRSPSMAVKRPVKNKRADGENESSEDSDEGFRELQFTHDDVANGRVQYVPTPVPAGSDTSPKPDNFGFTLTAPGEDIQPAVGQLAFEVVPPELPPVPDIDAGTIEEEPDDYEPDPEPAEDGGLAPEHVTTALIVAGGTLTSICSIVSYRCYRLSRRRRKRRLQKHMEALADQKRPPIELIDGRDLHPSEPLLIESRPGNNDYGQGDGDMRRRKAEAWLADHGIETEPRYDDRQNRDFRYGGNDRAARSESLWPFRPNATDTGRGTDGREGSRQTTNTTQNQPAASSHTGPLEGHDILPMNSRNRTRTSDADRTNNRTKSDGVFFDALRSSNSNGAEYSNTDAMTSRSTEPHQTALRRQTSMIRNTDSGTVDQQQPLPSSPTRERNSSQSNTMRDPLRYSSHGSAVNNTALKSGAPTNFDGDGHDVAAASSAREPTSAMNTWKDCRTESAAVNQFDQYGDQHCMSGNNNRSTPSTHHHPSGTSQSQQRYHANAMTSPNTGADCGRNMSQSGGYSSNDTGNGKTISSRYGVPSSGDLVAKPAEYNEACRGIPKSTAETDDNKQLKPTSSQSFKSSNKQTRPPKSVHYVDQSPYAAPGNRLNRIHNGAPETADTDTQVTSVDAYNDSDNILLADDYRSRPRTPCLSIAPSSDARSVNSRYASVNGYNVTDDVTDPSHRRVMPRELPPPNDHLTGYPDETQLDFVPWMYAPCTDDGRGSTSRGEGVDVDDGGYATGSTRGGRYEPQTATATRSVVDEDECTGDDDGGGVVVVEEMSEHITTLNRDQIVYDWQQVDPDLLDLCRKTTPILHKNQYWV